jgi:hypothetical protein
VIPPFDGLSGNLPPGQHEAGWEEFEAHYGWNEHRNQLLAGLRPALQALAECGCSRIWIDGSFVTDKELPGDFDACWDPTGVDLQRLQDRHPVLLNFSQGRARQKAIYRGELFLANFPADFTGRLFLDFFQTDKRTGERKGIIMSDPRDVT